MRDCIEISGRMSGVYSFASKAASNDVKSTFFSRRRSAKNACNSPEPEGIGEIGEDGIPRRIREGVLGVPMVACAGGVTLFKRLMVAATSKPFSSFDDVEAVLED
jgi:hypothetical protein